MHRRVGSNTPWPTRLALKTGSPVEWVGSGRPATPPPPGAGRSWVLPPLPSEDSLVSAALRPFLTATREQRRPTASGSWTHWGQAPRVSESPLPTSRHQELRVGTCKRRGVEDSLQLSLPLPPGVLAFNCRRHNANTLNLHNVPFSS